ncbi:MAG TPA: hypothetical protein VIB48_06370 [Acidimicrobiia bacterium]|jgi:hypothetical protein
MARSSLVVALVACSLTLAACGGSGRLAPLENSDTDLPSTTATTAPATAVRDVLKALVDVGGPAGYEQVPPDLDTDPGSLSTSLEEQFRGAGFQWAMRRNWADGAGDTVTLFVGAFSDPRGAAQAFACGCGGDPVPGVPGAVVDRTPKSFELSLAVGSFLVMVDGGGPSPASTQDVAAVAGAVRQRVLGLGPSGEGLVGGASTGGTAV